MSLQPIQVTLWRIAWCQAEEHSRELLDPRERKVLTICEGRREALEKARAKKRTKKPDCYRSVPANAADLRHCFLCVRGPTMTEHACAYLHFPRHTAMPPGTASAFSSVSSDECDPIGSPSTTDVRPIALDPLELRGSTTSTVGVAITARSKSRSQVKGSLGLPIEPVLPEPLPARVTLPKPRSTMVRFASSGPVLGVYESTAACDLGEPKTGRGSRPSAHRDFESHEGTFWRAARSSRNELRRTTVVKRDVV